MKNIFLVFVLFISVLTPTTIFSQTEKEAEGLGLPGDNLDLYAVLDLFQKSKTIEDFEKSLNAEDKKINNLDLDNDKKVDFIKVVTKKEGDNYTFILEDEVSKTETQDVAVILVDKDKSGKVTMQIVGDEELYGKNYIIEPNTSKVTANPGYTGDEPVTQESSKIVVVESAPIVQYVYSPAYIPYYPSYYYGFYPPYFRPWAPLAWGIYWNNHSYYRGGYYGGYHSTTVIHHSNNYNHYNNNYRNSSNTVSHYNSNGNYTNNGNRPSTRPSTGNVNRPSTMPSTRPSTGNVNRPSTMPSTRPSTGNVNRPSTMPSTRPSTGNVNRPSTMPSTRPSTGNINRGSSGYSRPSNSSYSGGRSGGGSSFGGGRSGGGAMRGSGGRR